MDVLSQVIGAMRAGEPRSYVVECRPPWARQYASLPGAGLHVVLEGSVWLDGPDRPPVRLAVGDVVLMPSGQGHVLSDPLGTAVLEGPVHDDRDGRGRVVIGPDGPATTGPRSLLLCGMYELDRRRAHPLMRELPDVVHLPGRLGRHQELNAAVTLLASELLGHRQGGHAATNALLDLLFIQVLRAWHDEQGGEAAWSAALTDTVIGDALRHMHDRPDRPWTVAELAALVGLSRAAFAKRFKDLVGEAPLSYLTWWRMTLAAKLLETSDLSLAEVASRVGYSTEYAFGAAFKRELGSAPGGFRRARTIVNPPMSTVAT